ncbi:uncharacterized protein [Atheta coriaria]|uniref:uncharacterized protein n=1 Tax=Dalotia coriaria TaxID=877792 RepID=UPI0031F41EC8
MRSVEVMHKKKRRITFIDHNEYRQQILNRLVELSFHVIWEWLIEVVIVISIFNAIYVTFFDPDESNLFMYYYCLEAVFLYDTFIGYIHRFHVRMFSLQPPRGVIILLLDTLSLAPIYEFCYIALPEYATPTLQKFQQLKTILRSVHLITTLFVERFVSAKMHIAVIKLTHLFLLLLVNLILACWWSYEGRCWPNCEKPNWSDSLVYLTRLSPENPLIWFLTCFTSIGDKLIHGSPGFLIDQNDTETCIILTALSLGFAMHTFFGVAHVFNTYVDVLRTRYNYKLHLSKLHFLFDSCAKNQENSKLKLRTLEYYHLLWKKRKGLFLLRS